MRARGSADTTKRNQEPTTHSPRAAADSTRRVTNPSHSAAGSQHPAEGLGHTPRAAPGAESNPRSDQNRGGGRGQRRQRNTLPNRESKTDKPTASQPTRRAARRGGLPQQPATTATDATERETSRRPAGKAASPRAGPFPGPAPGPTATTGKRERETERPAADQQRRPRARGLGHSPAQHRARRPQPGRDPHRRRFQHYVSNRGRLITQEDGLPCNGRLCSSQNGLEAPRRAARGAASKSEQGAGWGKRPKGRTPKGPSPAGRPEDNPRSDKNRQAAGATAPATRSRDFSRGGVSLYLLHRG